MKHFVTLLFFFTTAIYSVGQSVYESPCVVDGKTFQMTIPEGFIKVETPFTMRTVYTTLEEADFANGEVEGLDMGSIIIYYDDTDGRTLDDYLKKLQKEQEEVHTELDFTVSPQKVSINNRDILFAASKGNLRGVPMNAMYAGIMLFGERTVNVGYVATESHTDFMSFDEFKSMFSTLTEIETDKEEGPENDLEAELRMYLNELEIEVDLPEDEEVDTQGLEETDTEYYERIDASDSPSSKDSTRIQIKDPYETKFEHLDVMAHLGEDWDLPISRKERLLSAFDYKNEQSTLEVFSGGDASNYPNMLGLVFAIREFTGKSYGFNIVYDSELLGENHTFKVYKIRENESGWFYTTEVDGELIFFVAETNTDEVAEFKEAANAFMLSMWVEDFDD